MPPSQLRGGVRTVACGSGLGRGKAGNIAVQRDTTHSQVARFIGRQFESEDNIHTPALTVQRPAV
jgi:hypothetical protein